MSMHGPCYSKVLLLEGDCNIIPSGANFVLIKLIVASFFALII